MALKCGREGGTVRCGEVWWWMGMAGRMYRWMDEWDIQRWVLVRTKGINGWLGTWTKAMMERCIDRKLNE